jgi:hypothetical protein
VPDPQIPDVAWSALAMPKFNMTRLSRGLTEPQLLRTERVYSPFAKTFLASRDEEFATGSNVGGRRLKKDSEPTNG